MRQQLLKKMQKAQERVEEQALREWLHAEERSVLTAQHSQEEFESKEEYAIVASD